MSDIPSNPEEAMAWWDEHKDRDDLMPFMARSCWANVAVIRLFAERIAELEKPQTTSQIVDLTKHLAVILDEEGKEVSGFEFLKTKGPLTIPKDATIQSATLTINVDDDEPIGGNAKIVWKK